MIVMVLCRRVLSNGFAVLAIALVVCGALFVALAEGGEGGGSGSVMVSSPHAFVFEAATGLGANGFAVAVWNQDVGSDGGCQLVVATRASARADWSAADTLEKVTYETTFTPEVAVAPSGAAVVAWQDPQAGGRDPEIDAVSRSSADSSWTRPAAIASGFLSDDTRALGVDARGDAVLVYTAGSGTAQQMDSVSFEQPSGSWGQPVVVGRSSSPIPDPTVAVSAKGDAVAAWSSPRRPPSGGSGNYRYDSWVEASQLRSGVWSAPQRLGQETEFIYDADSDATPDSPEAAIDDHGRAMVIWQHDRGGTRLVIDAAALGVHTATWRALPALRATGIYGPQLVASPDGWVTIAWEREQSGIATTAGPISGCCWSRGTTLKGPSGLSDFDLNLVAGPGHAAALTFAKVGQPIQLAVHPITAGGWRRPASLTPGPGHGRTEPIPQSLSVSPTGQLLTAWTQESPSSTAGLLNAPLDVTSATER